MIACTVDMAGVSSVALAVAMVLTFGVAGAILTWIIYMMATGHRVWRCPECKSLAPFARSCGICGAPSPGARSCLGGCGTIFLAVVLAATLFVLFVHGIRVFGLDPSADDVPPASESSEEE